MIYEFCAENVTLLEKAMQSGARRIELCDNLAVGGTTPSYGVTKAARYDHYDHDSSPWWRLCLY